MSYVTFLQGGFVLDVAEVMAYADAFRRAIVADQSELISRYVCREHEAGIVGILGSLPRPIQATEVLRVSVLETGEAVSVTEVLGQREGVRVRTTWVEGSEEELLIRDARIFHRESR
jgi:hypothetical protein